VVRCPVLLGCPVVEGVPMNAAPKKKAPTRDQASGAFGEQNELFDLPAFCPILPPNNSAAAQALADLCAGDVTQIDWLHQRKGWRLAAAVKELGYLGWEPVSVLVQSDGWPRPIARYSLRERAKQAAHALRNRGGAAHASE
jgi:hypothetical protein